VAQTSAEISPPPKKNTGYVPGAKAVKEEIFFQARTGF